MTGFVIVSFLARRSDHTLSKETSTYLSRYTITLSMTYFQ